MIMHAAIPYLLCLLAGVLYAFGFPGVLFPQVFIFPMIGFGILHFFIGQTDRLKTKLIYVFCLALGLTFSGFYWIPYTIHEFGGIYPPFNYLLAIGFCLIVVPQYFVYVFIEHFLRPKFARVFSYTSFLAFLLTFLEMYTPQQFPAHLGHPWLQLGTWLGLAPIIGAVGFSFFSYLISLEVVRSIRTKKINIISVSAISVFLLFNFIRPLKIHNHQEQSLNIRMVQANIGSLMKVQSESGIISIVRSVLNTYEELTFRESQIPNEEIDLIIWPETAYPNQVQSELIKHRPRLLPKVFYHASKGKNADFFTGGYNSRKHSNDLYFESEYNAAFFVHRNGELSDVYHKMKLIPFGEGLPFGPLNQYFSKVITNITYFAQGDRYTLFKTSDGYRFSTAICYEILFTNFIREYLNQTKEHPSFMINITNDSWYGPTSEPHQHLFLSKWRSVENNIPIIRMTNTGISSILYPDSSESKRTGVFTKEILDLKLTFDKNRKPTIYQTYGPFIFFLLFLIVFSLHWITDEKEY